MKRLLLIVLSLLFLSIGVSQNRVNVNNLVKYGDKYFKKNDDRSYDGMVFDTSKETSNKILEYKMLKGEKNGIYKEWYPNGAIKTKGKYLNGIEDRMWLFWYENGLKEKEGRYKDGVKDGLWFEWDLNGKIKEEVRYSIDNKIEETIYTYYENGNKKSKEKWANGKRDGLFTYWDENGLKLKEGKYRNGLMEGKWEFLFFDKKVEKWRSLKGSFKSGDGGNRSKNSGVPRNGRNGLFTVFYSNGKKKSIKYYKDGTLDGKIKKYYENGQMESQTTFKDGIMVGKYESWFDDGNKELEYYYNDDGTRDPTKLTITWHANGQKSFEGYIKTINDKNVRDGITKNYYENGQMELQVTFKDGIMVGKYEFWFDDGTKNWEYYYNDDGTRDSTKLTTRWYANGQKWYEAYIMTINGEAKSRGEYTGWYENGNIQYKGNYLSNGKWEGKDFNWYEDGQKQSETTYKNGELISSKEWNKDGSVKERLNEKK